MPLSRIILLLLATGTLGATAKDKPRRVDLAKLRDPAERVAEAGRLLGRDDGDEKYKYIITDLRLHKTRINDADIQLILLTYDLDFSSRDWFDGYQVDNPDELFGSTISSTPDADGFHPPSLAPLKSCRIIPVDSTGREIKVPDSSTYLSKGYVFDFNRDGVLDIADTSNYGAGKGPDGKKRSGQVFELTPLGSTTPIFRAVYNWSLFPKNGWEFECFDEDDDGFAEIAFGPPGERRVVFRWDQDAKQYTAPPDPHVVALAPGQVHDSLETAFAAHDKQVAATTPTDQAEPNKEEWKHPEAPYEFQSLKDASDAEIFAFFHGRQPADSFRASQSVAHDPITTHLPPDFWNLPPKQAALQLAESNRTPAHRATFRLAVDDRNEVAPPTSGWLTHDFQSSGCYTLTTHQFAFRFGVEKPYLLHVAHSSHGVVGANPLVDRPGYAVRIVPMTAKESRFLVDTVFWLDRVRSRGDDDSSGGMSSSADGFATLTLHEDGKKPRKIGDETIWSTNSISERWTDHYEPATCLNLTEFLLDSAWLERIGERWKPAAALEFRNLSTSLEDRLKPRLDQTARELLTSNALTILSLHQTDPVPLSLLVEVIQCAGDEGLAELLDPIRAIADSLPPVNAEDEEYDNLRRRFARDHFGTPLHSTKEKEPENWKRYQELRKKRAHQPGPVLRHTVTYALRQLESLDRPDLLMTWALGNEAGYGWALQRLERHYPDAHADILLDQFEDAEENGKTRIFDTLAAASPKSALRLADTLDDKERASMLIEIAQLAAKEDPARLAKLAPDLFAILDKPDPDKPWLTDSAMQLLDQIDLPDADQARLDRALLAAFDAPKEEGPLPSSSIPAVIEILLKRSDRDRYWDLFVMTGNNIRGFRNFNSIHAALVQLSENRPDDRAPALEALCRHRLSESDGFMNDLFLKILQHDLRGLTDDLQALATSSPRANDGNGSSSAGGGFSGPQDYRYHAAREILALWAEPDAPTRARMWIALILNRPYEFHGYRDDSPDHQALRTLATRALKALPPNQRAHTVTTMRTQLPPGTTLPENTRAWLEELSH